MYAAIKYSYVMCKTFRPQYQCMQLCVLDGYLRQNCIVNAIQMKLQINARYMQSDLHYDVQPDSISLYM